MSAMLPAFALTAALALPKYELIMFIDHKFPGEIRNSLGFGAALQAHCDAEHASLTTIDFIGEKEEGLERARTYLGNCVSKAENAKTKYIVYATNTNGLYIFNKLYAQAPEIMSKVITIWCGHQYITDLGMLAGKVNMICLPRHVLRILTPEQAASLKNPATIVVSGMRGVPHNVTKEYVQEEYLAWSKDIMLPPIPKAAKYIGVVLGGDAPKPNGEILCFTVEEAQILARRIGTEAARSGATVLITNHPRTGLYNPLTLKKLPVHVKGETYIDPTDAVSLAFIAELSKSHVPFVFFNVAEGLKSAYYAILGAITHEDAHLVSAYITGESTSMVSEMSAIIPWLKLNIVQVGSMNEGHLAHMQDEMDCATGCGIRPNFASGMMEEIQHDISSPRESREPAAQTLVRALQPLLHVVAEHVATARPAISV